MCLAVIAVGCVTAVAGTQLALAAGQVSVSGDTLSYVGNSSRNTIRIDVDYTSTPFKLRVTETSGAALQAGSGCSGSGSVVLCAEGAVQYVDLQLGGGNDVATSPDLGFGPDNKARIFSVSGGSGSDLVIGTGAVRMDADGGDGVDWISSDANSTLRGGPDPDLLVAGDGYDKLYGGGGDDVIYTGEGWDTAEGNAGNDRIVPGPRDPDKLYGEDANSTTNDGLDTLDYSGAGTKPIRVNLSESPAIVSVSGVPQDTATGFSNVIGGAGPDLITGDEGANILRGAPGNDTLRGLDGADELDGGAGVDTADYSARQAGVVVSVANNGSAPTGDDGEPGEQDNVITENVLGGHGGDLIAGDDKANTLVGCDGSDWLVGGGAPDVLSDYAYLVCAGGGDVNLYNSALDGSVDQVLCGPSASDRVAGGANDMITITGSLRCEVVYYF